MARTRRRFDAGFKAKVALEAVREVKSLSEIAQQFKVHPNQVTIWKKQLLSEAGRIFEAGEGKRGKLFLPDAEGRRACHGDDLRYAHDPAWKNLVLFYEYFHGDTGRGLGASHQTGWTALAAPMLADLGRIRR